MKKFLTLLFVCSILTCFSQTIDGLDKKYGFRDLRFETDKTSIKGLVAKGPSYGGIRIYSRPSDRMELGYAKLTSVEYNFYQNRLYGVILQADVNVLNGSMLDALTDVYGEGEHKSDIPGAIEREWRGQLVDMAYREDAYHKRATVYIFSRPLLARLSIDTEKAGKQKSASDL